MVVMSGRQFFGNTFLITFRHNKFTVGKVSEISRTEKTGVSIPSKLQEIKQKGKQYFEEFKTKPKRF